MLPVVIQIVAGLAQEEDFRNLPQQLEAIPPDSARICFGPLKGSW